MSPLHHEIPLPGTVITSSTDPALDANDRVQAYTVWQDTSVSPSVLRSRNAANTGWVILTAGMLGRFTDTFTATLNQTSFTLTHTPVGLSDFGFNLNSIPQDPANALSLSGKVLTVSTGLNAGDTLAINYVRLD